MDEKQVVDILFFVKTILFGFITIGAFLYVIPLCCIRRFHKSVHLLTANVCIASIVFSIFWIISNTMDLYYPSILWTTKSCLPIIYLQNMVVCQVLYALCVVSLNRLFTIIYKNKALFHTNKWAALCVSAQWIFAGLIPLPILTSNINSCLIKGLELSYRIYLFIIAIILPAIFLTTTSTIIFVHARHSTQRLHPMNGNSAQALSLGPRDARLLKHMVFMFVVFFCGWAPIYIIKTVVGKSTGFSLIVQNVFLTIPSVSLFIDVVDLFLYNHELRKYFTGQR